MTRMSGSVDELQSSLEDALYFADRRTSPVGGAQDPGPKTRDFRSVHGA